MEKEKEVIGILEAKFFYVRKKDFEEYRFAFAGVCECACLSIKLKNGDMILYHGLKMIA